MQRKELKDARSLWQFSYWCTLFLGGGDEAALVVSYVAIHGPPNVKEAHVTLLAAFVAGHPLGPWLRGFIRSYQTRKR